MPIICAAPNPILLTIGRPFGGIYSGRGVVNGYLNTSIAGIGPDTIIYTYKDKFACTNSRALVIYIKKQTQLSITGNSFACKGEKVSYKVTSNNPVIKYQWQDSTGFKSWADIINQNDSVYIINSVLGGQSGNKYRCKILDSCGISYSASIKLNITSLFVFFTPNKNKVCEDETPFALSGGVPLGGVYSGPGVSNGIFYPAVAGIGSPYIKYKYTDANQCSDSASSNIYVQACIGISNSKNFNNVKVIPNPSQGLFKIETNGNTLLFENGIIEVYNSLGKKIIKRNIKDLNDFIVDISERSNGVYFFVIQLNDEKVYYKLVKL